MQAWSRFSSPTPTTPGCGFSPPLATVVDLGKPQTVAVATLASSRPSRHRSVRPAVVRFRRLHGVAIRRAAVLGCHFMEPLANAAGIHRSVSPPPLHYADLAMSGSVCTPASTPATPGIHEILPIDLFPAGCEVSTPDFGQRDGAWRWAEVAHSKVLSSGRKGHNEHEAALDSILERAELKGRAEREALVNCVEDLKAQCEASLERESQLRETIQKVREQLECGICMQALCWPVSLRCGHSFCSQCVARWEVTSSRSGKPLTCPTCRACVGLPSTARALDNVCRVVEEEDSSARRAEELDAYKKYESACNAWIANAAMPAAVRGERHNRRAMRSVQALPEVGEVDAPNMADLRARRFVEVDAPVLPDLRAPTLSAVGAGRGTAAGNTALTEEMADVHRRANSRGTRREAGERIW